MDINVCNTSIEENKKIASKSIWKFDVMNLQFSTYMHGCLLYLKHSEAGLEEAVECWTRILILKSAAEYLHPYKWNIFIQYATEQFILKFANSSFWKNRPPNICIPAKKLNISIEYETGKFILYY